MWCKDCFTSDTVIQYIKEIVEKVPLKKVQQDLAKDFYNMDETIAVLYYAMLTGSNVILYGPGGFGKTELTKAFLNYFDIPSIVKVGYSGMDVEALLGIPDIKKLMNESEYKVAFEKSIFNNAGVLVLEEFLDVKPTVAAALKDILTAGGLREGENLIPSKIGPVIICSNKSPDEVTTDLSTAAFYKERFPYSINVNWTDFSTKAYMQLFDIVKDITPATKDKYQLIAEICSYTSTNGDIVSPRIALEATSLYLTSKSIDSIKYISILDLSKVETIQNQIRVNHIMQHLSKDLQLIRDEIFRVTFDTKEEILKYQYLAQALRKMLSDDKFRGDKLLALINDIFMALDRKDTALRVALIDKGLKVKGLPALTTLYEKVREFKDNM